MPRKAPTPQTTLPAGNVRPSEILDAVEAGDLARVAGLANDSNVNERGPLCRTPLEHLILTRDRVEGRDDHIDRVLIRLLVSRGARLQDGSALALAAGAGDTAMVDALLALGAPANVALEDAAASGSPRMVATILERASPPRARVVTAMRVAAHKGHVEILRLLHPYAGTPDSAAVVASLSMARNPETLHCLMEIGFAPQARDHQGNTALHDVRVASVATALIAAGSPTNPRGGGGDTPIMAQARRGSLHLVEVLVRAGANVNAVNDHGLTALHYAARIRRKADRASLVELLVRAGADVAAANAHGRSILFGRTRSVVKDLWHGIGQISPKLSGRMAGALVRDGSQVLGQEDVIMMLHAIPEEIRPDLTAGDLMPWLRSESHDIRRTTLRILARLA